MMENGKTVHEQWPWKTQKRNRNERNKVFSSLWNWFSEWLGTFGKLCKGKGGRVRIFFEVTNFKARSLNWTFRITFYWLCKKKWIKHGWNSGTPGTLLDISSIPSSLYNLKSYILHFCCLHFFCLKS